MHTEGFVSALNAHRHVDPALDIGVFFVFLTKFRRRRFRADHLLELGRLAAHHRDQLGEPIGIAVGNIEHPCHILQHRFRGHAVKGDDLGHLVFAIAARHIIDHLAAAFDAEVGINIRHGFAFRIEEALKQQAINHRINVGDPQGVGHQGAGGRAPARPHRNAVLAGEADVVPHHQEVGGEAHLLHHLQLKGHAIAVGGVDRFASTQAQPITQARFGDLGQVGDRRVARGDREAGHLVAPKDVVVLHLVGHQGRVRHRLGHDAWLQVVGKEGEHLRLALDVFGAGVAQPLLIAHQLSGQHAEQGVVGFDVVAGEVVGVVGGDQGNPEFGGDAHDLGVDDAIFRRAVVLDFQVEVLAKALLVPAGHLPSHVRAALEDRLGDLAAQAGGGHDQALAVLLQGGLINAGARKDAPAAHAAQVADAGELDQVAVAGGVLGQHDQVVAPLLLRLGIVDRSVHHIHLVADDRLDAGGLAELEQLDGAIHHTVVGEGQGRHAQLHGPLHHLGQLGGPIEEAVVAVVVERNEGQGRDPGFPHAKARTQDSGSQAPKPGPGTPHLVEAPCPWQGHQERHLAPARRRSGPAPLGHQGRGRPGRHHLGRLLVVVGHLQ